MQSSLVGLAVLVSIVLHGLLMGALAERTLWRHDTKPKEPVKVKIVKQEPRPEVKAPEPPKPLPEPEKPKPKPKPKPEKKITSERPQKPQEAPVKPPAPVLGVSPDATVKDGKGIAVPLGNTLLTEDTGQRLKANEVQPLGQEDLSAAAKLIRTSLVRPEYTDDALDAGLEGTVVVEVFVTADGRVTSAEVRSKVGYGMDQKLVAAALKARFQPRKDQYGRALEGWSEIKFQLELP